LLRSAIKVGLNESGQGGTCPAIHVGDDAELREPGQEQGNKPKERRSTQKKKRKIGRLLGK